MDEMRQLVRILVKVSGIHVLKLVKAKLMVPVCYSPFGSALTPFKISPATALGGRTTCAIGLSCCLC